MKGAVLIICLVAVIIFTVDKVEGRGHRHGHKRHHHHREPDTYEASSSGSFEDLRHYGRAMEGEEGEAPAEESSSKKGWFSHLKDAAYDLSNIAYDKVTSTDWKAVGSAAWDKAQKIGAAAISRKKRSGEIVSAEQLIPQQEHFEEQVMA